MRTLATGSLLVLLLFLAGCAPVATANRPGKAGIAVETEVATFLDRAWAIMTDEEISIFRSLPDADARAEMIRDFWRLRDPDGGSERNAFRREFDARVEFANKWFSLIDPARGRDVPGRAHPKNGSRSDRGRTYILFGPGDKMDFMVEGDPMSEGPGGDVRVPWFRKVTDDREFAFESWYYFENNMVAAFTKSRAGRWEGGPLGNMVWSIEDFKRRPVEAHYRSSGTKPLSFGAKLDGGVLRLTVPAAGVRLDEGSAARLRTIVNVYRGDARVDRLERDWRIVSVPEGTGDGAVPLEIEYAPQVPGKLGFEIILEDLQARTFSRARTFLRGTLRPATGRGGSGLQ